MEAGRERDIVQLKMAIITYYDITRDADGVYTNENYTDFLNELAGLVGRITFVGALAKPDHPEHYRDGKSSYRRPLAHPNLDVVFVGEATGQLPFWATIKKAFNKIVSIWGIIGEADVVYITVPYFNGLIAAFLCLLRGKPYGFYVAADWNEFIEHSVRTGEWKHGSHRLRRRVSLWGDAFLSRRAAYIVVAGDKSLGKYLQLHSNSHAVKPMLNITPNDFLFARPPLQLEKYRLIYVGALLTRKNIDKILEAVATLEQRRPGSVICDIVGHGPADYTDFIIDLARKLNVRHAVKFHGRVTDKDELRRLYRRSDIFLLPSTAEGFPRVLYEAMSQGCLVAASDISTIVAMLTQDQDFIALDPDRSETIVDAVERFYANPDFVTKMRARNENFIRTRIVNMTTAQQLIDVLEATPGISAGHA